MDLPKGAGAIISLDVAHSNPGSVIVGTSDGNVQWSNDVFTGANCTFASSNTASFACTANAGANWVNLTDNNTVLPNRVISGVAYDPVINNRFYAAVGGFNTNTPATPGHVFMGTCASSPCTGANFTWTDKTGNLPDIPFTAVAVNPNNPTQVFVGSYLGFYYTNYITADPPYWARYQTGLPNTRINYLAVDRGVAASPRTSTTLGAFTYGRGLYVTQINVPPSCTMPAVATPGPVTAPADNQIAVSWSAGAPPGNTYRIYRSATGCAGTFSRVAIRVLTSPWVDTTVSG